MKEALARVKHRTIADRRKNRVRLPLVAFWLDRGRLVFDLLAVVSMCAWRERRNYLGWIERHESHPDPERKSS
jgi:hypothetical protein